MSMIGAGMDKRISAQVRLAFTLQLTHMGQERDFDWGPVRHSIHYAFIDERGDRIDLSKDWPFRPKVLIRKARLLVIKKLGVPWWSVIRLWKVLFMSKVAYTKEKEHLVTVETTVA